MNQKKIKLPKRVQKPNLPKKKKPKAETLQDQQMQEMANAVATEAENLTQEQKDAVRAYGEALMIAMKAMAKAKLGPTASPEQGSQYLDMLPVDVTEFIMKQFGGQCGMNELFAVLGSSAGYQVGIALGKSGTDMTEGMIKTACLIFEGGLRMTASSTKQAMKSGVLQVQKKVIQ